MSTGLIVHSSADVVPQKFARVATQQKIAEYQQKYGELVVTDPRDPKQVKVVREARLDVRKPRLAVDKLRKELNADALEYQRTVNKVAKELSTPLEELEARLQAEEDRVEQFHKDEKQRIVQSRVDALFAVGYEASPQYVGDLPEEIFREMLQDKSIAYEAKLEKERVEKARANLLLTRQKALVQRKAFIAPDILLEMTDEEFDRKCVELQRKANEAEQERAAEVAMQGKIEVRLGRLAVVGGSLTLDQVRLWSDEAFNLQLEQFQKLREQEEAERLEQQRQIEADRERLKAEREEADRKAQAERDALQADRERLAADQQRLLEEQQREADRKAAEEEARREVERQRSKVEADLLLAEQEARDEEAARVRREALRPYRQRLTDYAKSIAFLPRPDMEGTDDGLVDADISQKVSALVNWLLAIAENL